ALVAGRNRLGRGLDATQRLLHAGPVVGVDVLHTSPDRPQRLEERPAAVAERLDDGAGLASRRGIDSVGPVGDRDANHAYVPRDLTPRLVDDDRARRRPASPSLAVVPSEPGLETGSRRPTDPFHPSALW